MIKATLLKRRELLEFRVAAAQDEIGFIDGLLRALPADSGDRATVDVFPNEKYLGTRFAQMTTSEAILQFVGERRPLYVSPLEIRDGLVLGGFRSNSERPENVIHVACDRLVERGQLELGDKDGNKAYRLTEQGEHASPRISRARRLLDLTNNEKGSD